MPQDTVFISYARTDSEFVDRLEADLQARMVPTWIDRRKLQGGQDWLDEIQNALDHCRVLLVVLSPDAVSSRHARTEYRYALSRGKPVIPLLYRPCPSVPMDLNDIQWVIFQDDYDKGLNDLLVALAALPAVSASVAGTMGQTFPASVAQDEDPVNLVAARPAPQTIAADLSELYRSGVRARSEGDFERAAILWQQILDRDPNFGADSLAGQMRLLNQQLRPARIQRLRQRVAGATQAGEWGKAVGAYRALLGVDPQDLEARNSLPIALRSQAEQSY